MLIDKNKVGLYIKLLRVQKGFTQNELAKALNVTFQAVSRWENGDSLPDSSILIELGEVLGSNVETILRGGNYFANERKLISVRMVSDSLEHLNKCINALDQDIKMRQAILDGIESSMHFNFVDAYKSNRGREALIGEVLIQCVLSGKYYVSKSEVVDFFSNDKIKAILLSQ